MAISRFICRELLGDERLLGGDLTKLLELHVKVGVCDMQTAGGRLITWHGHKTSLE
jgi:hypothetical protein